jgi:hypothetical protein
LKSEVSFGDLTVANPVLLATRKQIFATVKSTIYTDNSSNTVLFMSTTIVEFLCLYAPRSYWNRWYIESIEELSVSIVDLTDYFLAEGIWKVHIFHHLLVCFQTSVYIRQQSIDFVFCNLSSSGDVVYRKRWWHWHKLVTDLFYILWAFYLFK